MDGRQQRHELLSLMRQDVSFCLDRIALRAQVGGHLKLRQRKFFEVDDAVEKIAEAAGRQQELEPARRAELILAAHVRPESLQLRFICAPLLLEAGLGLANLGLDCLGAAG